MPTRTRRWITAIAVALVVAPIAFFLWGFYRFERREFAVVAADRINTWVGEEGQDC